MLEVQPLMINYQTLVMKRKPCGKFLKTINHVFNNQLLILFLNEFTVLMDKERNVIIKKHFNKIFINFFFLYS